MKSDVDANAVQQYSVPVATFHEYAAMGIWRRCHGTSITCNLILEWMMEGLCQGAVVSNDVLDSTLLRMYTDDGCHVSTTLANAILNAQSNAWRAGLQTEEKS